MYNSNSQLMKVPADHLEQGRINLKPEDIFGQTRLPGFKGKSAEDVPPIPGGTV